MSDKHAESDSTLSNVESELEEDRDSGEDYDPFTTNDLGQIVLKQDEWAFAALSRRIFSKSTMEEIYAQGEEQRRKQEYEDMGKFAYSQLGKPSSTEEEIQNIVNVIIKVETLIMRVVGFLTILIMISGPELEQMGWLPYVKWVPAFGVLTMIMTAIVVTGLLWGAGLLVWSPWDPLRNWFNGN